MKRSIFSAVCLVAAMVVVAVAASPDGMYWYRHASRFPATQTIASGGVIAVDACGGIKRITAASAVTTDLTDSIGTPSSLNQGCVMDIVNVGTMVITIDANADFFAAAANGATDVILGTKHSARVASMGTYWVLVGSPNNVAP